MHSKTMNILTINTAFSDLGMSLMKNEKLVANYYSICKKQSETLIFQTLDAFLKNTQTTLEEIDLYVVVQGPGSFTGIRIGMAVAKTLAQVHQKPIVGVTSLELLGAMAAPLEEPFYVLLNCTRSEVFYAKFQLESQNLVQLTEIHLTTLENLWQKIEKFPVILKRVVSSKASSHSLFDQLALHTLQYPIADGYPLLKLGQAHYSRCQGNFPIIHPLYIKREVPGAFLSTKAPQS